MDGVLVPFPFLNRHQQGQKRQKTINKTCPLKRETLEGAGGAQSSQRRRRERGRGLVTSDLFVRRRPVKSPRRCKPAMRRANSKQNSIPSYFVGLFANRSGQITAPFSPVLTWGLIAMGLDSHSPPATSNPLG